MNLEVENYDICVVCSPYLMFSLADLSTIDKKVAVNAQNLILLKVI